MDSIERQLKKLESMLSSNKISWRTTDGEAVSCFPSELFDPDPELKRKIINADLNTCTVPGSLLGFCRAFLMSSEPSEEKEKDIRVAEMLKDLGIPFHWKKGEYERR
ncbi:MAG TPA: hypothetical protein VHT73_06245 [Thermodesulfobacteriota bacterium]|nr:hypothetical protein [Thermodesulfobacteriota bacterium]